MAKVPKIYCYNVDEQLINIPGYGAIGDNLYRFSYKYSETEDDEINIELVFNSTLVPIQFLQPNIGIILRWGYIGGPISSKRETVITRVKYGHNASGYKVTLTLVPLAQYNGSGVVRDPNGLPLKEDVAEKIGEAKWQFKGPAGQIYEYIVKKDGTVEGKHLIRVRQPDGTIETVPFAAIAEKELTEAERVEAWRQLFITQFGFDVSGTGEIGALVAFAALYGMSRTDPELVVTTQNIIDALYNYLKALGYPQIVKQRDGTTSLEEIAWNAPASFGVAAGDNLISWEIENAGEDGKTLQSSTTVVNPLTGDITTIETSTEIEEFTFINYDSKDDAYGKPAKYYKSGSDYYMHVEGYPEPYKFTDGGRTWNYRKDQKLKLEYYSEKLDVSTDELQDWLDEDGNRTLEGYAEKYRDDLKFKEAALAEKEGLTPKFFNPDDTRIGYSGRRAQDVRNAAVTEALNTLLYNTKLTVKMEGDPTLEDGENFSFFTENRVLSGKFHMDESEHIITAAGYTTTIVAYRVLEQFKQLVSTLSNIAQEGIEQENPNILNEQMVYDAVDWINFAQLRNREAMIYQETGRWLLAPGVFRFFYKDRRDEDGYKQYNYDSWEGMEESNPMEYDIDQRYKWQKNMEAESDSLQPTEFAPAETIEDFFQKQANDTIK